MNKTMNIKLCMLLGATCVLTAKAEAAAPSGMMMIMQQMVPILMIVLVFYFLIHRPQQKKQKQHQEMIDGMSKNDKIITNAGIVGKVSEITSQYLKLEVADDVIIEVLKNSVAQVLTNKERPVIKKIEELKKFKNAEKKTKKQKTDSI